MSDVDYKNVILDGCYYQELSDKRPEVEPGCDEYPSSARPAMELE